MAKPIVDIHIEKTAGRSKRLMLLEQFGADRVLHYDCVTDKLVRASDRLLVTENPTQERMQGLAQNRLLFPAIKLGYLAARYVESRRGFAPESLPADYDVITGHVTGTRLAGILDPSETTYTTVLRDPLARMRSHFEHWHRTRGLARFRVRPQFDPSLRFEDFALLPEMHNYQTGSIGIDPDQLRVIGLADKLPEYLEELGIERGSEVPHINKTSYKNNAVPDMGFVSDFQAANAADYELYEQTCAAWDVTAPTAA